MLASGVASRRKPKVASKVPSSVTVTPSRPGRRPNGSQNGASRLSTAKGKNSATSRPYGTPDALNRPGTSGQRSAAKGNRQIGLYGSCTRPPAVDFTASLRPRRLTMATSKQLARTPTQSTPNEAAWQPPGPRTRVPVLLFLGSIIVSFLAASSAPTPLYSVYAAHWGFSPLATTVVFGVYAVAVLAALLTFGRISDHIGRRPVLLAGLALQAVAMVVFATAGDLGTLLAARVVQGLAAGSSPGAGG